MHLFSEIGLVESDTFDVRRTRIERATSEHHDHLIDITTGRVIAFHSDVIERLQTEIAHRLGYALTGHRLELYARPVAVKPSSKRRKSR